MHDSVSRRAFLALAAAAPFARAFAAPAKPARGNPVPVGLEMYSLKDEEAKDRLGTLRAVAAMGYDGVEFWGPYFEWTPAYAREVRGQLDALGMKCFSTHTRRPYWVDESFPHIIELNRILGSRYVIMDHAREVAGLDGWKATAELLTRGDEKLKAAGLRAGFHNYPQEWKPVEGKRPIDVLAANTPADFHFQLDTATCLASGADPVAFVAGNPGRVKSYHLKDWSPDPEKGYRVLLGEGIGPWPRLFDVAESAGGVEFYLIEQEGSRLSPMETAKACLENFRKLRAGEHAPVTPRPGPRAPSAAARRIGTAC